MRRFPVLSLVVAAMAVCFAELAAAEDIGDQEAALAEPVSLTIEQDSLERCVQALEKKVRAKRPEVAIKFARQDLLLEGITINQTVRDYEAIDRPAAEVLTNLLMRAFPGRPVKNSRDPELKLIWVEGATPEDADMQVILITTRDAAAKRGDKLPQVFRPLTK